MLDDVEIKTENRTGKLRKTAITQIKSKINKNGRERRGEKRIKIVEVRYH